MKLKLLLDEDVFSDLSVALRKRGHDVIHIQELQLKGKTDKEQLNYAVKTGRCLFSFNVKDFVLLHNEYIQNNKNHGGIILSKQAPFKLIFNRLLIILQSSSKTEMLNKLYFI